MSLSMAINAEVARPSTAAGKSPEGESKAEGEQQSSEFAQALQLAFGGAFAAPNGPATEARAAASNSSSETDLIELNSRQQRLGELETNSDQFADDGVLPPGTAPLAGQASSSNGPWGALLQTASAVQGLARSAHLKTAFDAQTPIQSSGQRSDLGLEGGLEPAFKSMTALRMGSAPGLGFARLDGGFPQSNPGLMQSSSSALGLPTANAMPALSTSPLPATNPDAATAAMDLLLNPEDGSPTTTKGDLLTSGALGSTRASALPGSSPVPLAGSAFGQRVQDTVQWMITGRIQQAEIHLDPEHLGPISLQLRMDGQEAMVHFVAQHDTTRAAIEQNLQGLRDALAQAGLSLGQAQVGTQSQQQGFSHDRSGPSTAELRSNSNGTQGGISEAGRNTGWGDQGRSGQGLLDLFA